MPDPRDEAMARILAARERLGLAIQRDTLTEITRILEAARDRVVGQLAGAPSDYQRWSLTRLKTQIEAALAEIEVRGVDALKSGIVKSQLAGAEMIDAGIDAGLGLDGVKLEALVGEIALPELAALDQTLVPLVKGITREAGDRIVSTLGRTIAGAQPVHQTVTEIARVITVGGRARATTIVRTELGRAYAAAAQQRLEAAARVLPGVRKQWRRSGKLHSRPEHDAIDGQIRAVDQLFDVAGEKLLYPRDPAGRAKNTVNCGCTALPYMASWTVQHPGARRYSDEELAKSNVKRSLRDLSALPADRQSRAEQISSLEQGDRALARNRVAALLQEPAFRRFVSAPAAGDYPVGIIPSDLGAALGCDAQVVRLSQETAAKQLARHPDLTADDYRRLQHMLDRGEALEAGPRAIALHQLDEGAGLFRAVVKASRGGDELYLTSYTRIEPRYRQARLRERALLRRG